jgi:hypothetical protein
MAMDQNQRRIPSARVVSGVDPIHRPLGSRVSKAMAPARTGARTAAYYVVGLWPIVTVMGLAFALLWSAGMGQSP